MTKPIGELSAMLLNQKVGFVRITEKQPYRQTCEVAAWFDDFESDIGDFDLTLRADGLYPENLFVCATVPGTIVDNYNASLFGGVPVTTGTDRRGQRGIVPIKAPWANAAAEKAHRKGVEFVISISALDAAIEYAELKLREYIAGFPLWRDAYLREPRNKFHSSIGMVGHFGENMGEWARLLHKILWQKNWRLENLQYEKVQEPVRLAA